MAGKTSGVQDVRMGRAVYYRNHSNETYIPAQPHQARPPPWVSCPHVDPRRSTRDQGTSREGQKTPFRLMIGAAYAGVRQGRG